VVMRTPNNTNKKIQNTSPTRYVTDREALSLKRHFSGPSVPKGPKPSEPQWPSRAKVPSRQPGSTGVFFT
jgi:hypothetical protein